MKAPTKKEYDNYIFDLYGTLIDIHTDEENKELWEKTALFLSQNFGAAYEGDELHKRYLEICKEEEDKLRRKISAKYPEILIENVWVRLIQEKTLKNENGAKKEIVPDSEKIRELCIFFRETSRDKMFIYDGVIETFKKLKEMGKKIFLLSNAQRVFTEKELKDVGLNDCFDGIYISSDKQIKKPQTQFLSGLIREYFLNPAKCIMIGNEVLCDVGVAFNNGIDSVFLNTYNYPKDKTEKDLVKMGAIDEDYRPYIIEDGDIRKILDIGDLNTGK